MILWSLALVPAALGVVGFAARRRSWQAVVAASAAALLWTLGAGAWAAATQPSAAFGWGPVLELRVAVEGFARVMVVLVPVIASPIVAYAAVTEDEGRGRLLALMVVFVGVMELLVIAADLLTLLVAWELVGALSWALIGHTWREAANPIAAAQAFVTTRFGDLGLYAAAGFAFAATGSFAYDGLPTASGPELELIAAGVLLAAASKSAQLPFSPWLFSAMAGPTPVSALLHSSTMVAAGAYLLIRLAPAFEPVGWFGPAVAGVGIATALAGGVVAATQGHPKRALAGSTSAQYGLMLTAVGAGWAAAGGAQLLTHAAFKSLLFLGAGVAIHAGASERLGALQLGRSLPRIAALSAVGALALAAVPPLGGAWSKEQVAAAAAEASGWLFAGVLLAGFLSALYAGRYQLLAYGPGPEGPPRSVAHRPGPVELASLAVPAVLVVVLGLLWIPGVADVFEDLASVALPHATLTELVPSLAAIGAAAAGIWALIRRDALESLGLPQAARTFAAGWFGLPSLARALVVDPVLGLARGLARVDDRVIDAGIRAAAALARLGSRVLAWRGEVAVDALVHAAARSVVLAASGSRVTDDRGIDGAVEGVASGVGLAGRASRRLQTGLSHHYYVIVAVGLVAMAVALALAWG